MEKIDGSAVAAAVALVVVAPFLEWKSEIRGRLRYGYDVNAENSKLVSGRWMKPPPRLLLPGIFVPIQTADRAPRRSSVWRHGSRDLHARALAKSPKTETFR